MGTHNLENKLVNHPCLYRGCYSLWHIHTKLQSSPLQWSRQANVNKVNPSSSPQGDALKTGRQRFGFRMRWQAQGLGPSPDTETLMWQGSCVHERERRLFHASSSSFWRDFGSIFLSVVPCAFLLFVSPFVISREAVSGSIVCFEVHFLYGIGG